MEAANVLSFKAEISKVEQGYVYEKIGERAAGGSLWGSNREKPENRVTFQISDSAFLPDGEDPSDNEFRLAISDANLPLFARGKRCSITIEVEA